MSRADITRVELVPVLDKKRIGLRIRAIFVPEAKRDTARSCCASACARPHSRGDTSARFPVRLIETQDW